MAQSLTHSLVAVVKALRQRDFGTAAGVVTSLSNHTTVAGLANVLSGVKSKAQSLIQTLRELGPWAQIIVGLVAVAAGGVLVKGGLGVLLVLAGLCIAFGGIMKVIAQANI